MVHCLRLDFMVFGTTVANVVDDVVGEWRGKSISRRLKENGLTDSLIGKGVRNSRRRIFKRGFLKL